MFSSAFIEQIIASIVSGIVTALVVFMGVWAALKFERNRRELTILQNEIKARIALENQHCREIAKHTGESVHKVKIRMRDKTEDENKLRPTLSPKHKLLGDMH
jgi:TRAP-type uncharacterized transport system fused permease subunit